VAQVSRFGSQNRHIRFSDLCLKISTMFSWFGTQNQADFGLSVVSQNRRIEDNAGHASRTGDLLHLEASRARVSQYDLKTGVAVTTGGAHGTIAKIASGSS
jgi:hypothetical protein